VLRDEHFEAAHALVVEVTDWLNAKGIRQWPRPVPAEAYRGRHERGENFGLFDGDELLAVVTLNATVPDRWPELAPTEPFLWLGTLATAVRHKHRDLGPAMMAHAEAWAHEQGIARIYLDCVEGNGFLPGFYRALGYEHLDQRTWPGEPPWVMNLFAKGL